MLSGSMDSHNSMCKYVLGIVANQENFCRLFDDDDVTYKQ